MDKKNSTEKHLESTESVEINVLTVEQPHKLESLLTTLDDIEKISETIGEDKSTDLGGGTGGSTGDDSAASASVRKQLIMHLPSTDKMQKTLKKEIRKEVKSLRKEVRRITRTTKPGKAYKLNSLYARIRRLNAMIAELAEASYEVLKRLFVRVFIDKQTIL